MKTIVTKSLRPLLTASALLLVGLGRAGAQSTYTPYAISTFAGTVRTTGSLDGTPGTFSFPFGMAVDASGNVYVGDTYNDTIRKISATGVMSTLAGSVGVAGSTDATGSAAVFNHPEGVAVDASGNVYVADISNSTIRKITSTGVVTTLAGLAGSSGATDLTGAAARFNGPAGVAVDSSGNVYVADTYNDTIRKITPAGAVTTLAGSAGVQGSTNGTGSGALFYLPAGVAVDSSGNVYVADTYNDTIRKITPGGAVTTLAGTAGTSGSADGTGAAALFYAPIGIAVDSAGTVYVADTSNSVVRKVTSAGVVTTLAGQVKVQGSVDGAGINAQFNLPYGIAVDSSKAIYVGDTLNTTVRKGVATVSLITTEPTSRSISDGGGATFSVTATGSGLTYQWYLNGVTIAGATGSTLTLANVGTTQRGNYTVSVSNGTGTDTSTIATLAVTPSARLINISARGNVGTGNNILIAGFALSGSGSKQVLLRGVGPALASFLSGTLAHPQLTLYDNSSVIAASNIGWGNPTVTGPSTVSVSPAPATTSGMNSLGAYPIAAGSADSAMMVTTPTGNYTSQIAGVTGTSGIALAEVYDADPLTAPVRIVNLSARANVGTGNSILIGGFAVGGSTSETLLVRGVGPGLSALIGGTLSQPQLSVLDNHGVTIATNIGWGTASTLGTSSVAAGIQPATTVEMNSVGAYPIAPGSADCAMVVTLPPGNYTVQVTGTGSSTGIALVEFYELP